MFVNKFSMLWSPMIYTVKTSVLIILVCCRVHNFLIDRSIRFGDVYDIGADPNINSHGK